MLDVVNAGLETSIQDYPGRLGFWNQGFPPSGPMDSWSFRLANLLVGNPAGAAGLECHSFPAYPTPCSFHRQTTMEYCDGNAR